jgi:hypothetical protein
MSASRFSARAACAAFLLIGLHAPVSTAEAQGFAGTWEGTAAGRRVTITLDSGTAGWRGTALASSVQADSIPIAAITVLGDSATLRLPAAAMGAVLEGMLNAAGTRFDGRVIVEGNVAGDFRLARRGTPAAERLLADLAPARRPTADPDSARLVTSDIALFWDVLDRAAADSLTPLLQREYLERGTRGLRDFIPGRILSAERLAQMITSNRPRYDAIRASSLRVTEAEPGIRAAFRALKERYPDAVFPDVYFVIGRFNSGGTVSPNGLLIGAEMYGDPQRFPSIVAHELIHFQQRPLTAQPSLLVQSFREGGADFVGEMIAGVHINSAAHTYGMAHERELWKEFQEQMHGTSYTGWMYGDPPGERPADLGYFIGFRIAKAYYERAEDKAAALRDILQAADVAGILARSGYAP